MTAARRRSWIAGPGCRGKPLRGRTRAAPWPTPAQPRKYQVRSRLDLRLKSGARLTVRNLVAKAATKEQSFLSHWLPGTFSREARCEADYAARLWRKSNSGGRFEAKGRAPPPILPG